MAKKKDKDTDADTKPLDPNPATNDAYTGMLAIALTALIGGSVLLYLDFLQYPDKAPTLPKSGLSAGPQVGEAPKGGPPKEQPKVEAPPPKVEADKMGDEKKGEEKKADEKKADEKKADEKKDDAK